MDPRIPGNFFLPTIILIILSAVAISGATSSAGARTLLQATESCPVDFETTNYTEVTSQCKRPYNPTVCCEAFRAFACPFSQYVNNLTTVCAQSMFSYLNARGNYSGGFFGNLCYDSVQGITCPVAPPAALSAPLPAGGVVGIAAMFLVWSWIWV